MARADFDKRCCAVAKGQFGVLHGSQAAAEGGTPKMCGTRVRRGHWRKLFTNVYLMPGAPLSWEARAKGALLYAGNAALCARSAGRVWGLLGPEYDVVEIVTERNLRAAGVIVHRVRSMRSLVTVTRRGLLVTTPTQTIIDLAPFLTRPKLMAVLDKGLRLSLTHIPLMKTALQNPALCNVKGIPDLRDLVEKREGGAEGRTDSDLEAVTAEFLRRNKFDPSVCQYWIANSSGARRRVDFAWPDLQIGIECDSRKWHGGYEDLMRDVDRNNFYIAVGWRVPIATWDGLTRAFAQDLRGLLTDARLQLMRRR